MDTAEHRLAVREVAHRQGYMVLTVRDIFIAVNRELAVLRRELRLGFLFDQGFRFQARTDQLFDRDDLDVVLLREFIELGRAHHRAVVTHDLAAEAAFLQAGEAHQVDGRFRVAGALQDTAFSGLERKHMARAAEVFRFRVFLDTLHRGQGALHGRDSGRRVDMIDRNGEGRRVVVGVVLDHLLESELHGQFVAHRHTDESLRIARHEVDVLCRGVLGRADQVTFVLAVRVVDHEDDASGAQVVEGFRDGCQRWIVFQFLFLLFC